MNFKHFLYESYHRPRRIACNLFDEPAVVLLYHRVADLASDPQQLAVTPDNFYFQIEYLKKNYSLLRIDEFADLLNGNKRFPKRSVLVTFDDGYKDNHTEARPILESLGVQALFYITTSLLGTSEELWWDDLERILLLHETLPIELSFDVRNVPYRFPTATETERQSAYHAMHPVVKYLKPNERAMLFRKLHAWASIGAEGRESHRLMTKDELSRFSGSPSVIIGAHTHTHTPLSVLSRDEQRSDIVLSLNILKESTQVPVTHFSYPFGLKKDYTGETVAILEELGFTMSCANYEDQVHRWTPRFEVPRYLVRNFSRKEFQRRIRRHFLY